MNKYLPQELIFCFILFIGSILFSSCEKIPGHATGVTPTTTTSGSSTTGGNSGGTPTFSVGTGTITFIINNGATNTWAPPAYFVGLGTTPTTGALVFSPTPSTLITSGPNNVQQFLTNSFSISFAGTTPGTYPMDIAGSFVTQNGVTLVSGGGSEKVTVTSENITITSTSLGTAKGSATGTFDGKMINMATYDSVRVSGTFNVQQ